MKAVRSCIALFLSVVLLSPDRSMAIPLPHASMPAYADLNSEALSNAPVSFPRPRYWYWTSTLASLSPLLAVEANTGGSLPEMGVRLGVGGALGLVIFHIRNKNARIIESFSDQHFTPDQAEKNKRLIQSHLKLQLIHNLSLGIALWGGYRDLILLPFDWSWTLMDGAFFASSVVAYLMSRRYSDIVYADMINFLVARKHSQDLVSSFAVKKKALYAMHPPERADFLFAVVEEHVRKTIKDFVREYRLSQFSEFVIAEDFVERRMTLEQFSATWFALLSSLPTKTAEPVERQLALVFRDKHQLNMEDLPRNRAARLVSTSLLVSMRHVLSEQEKFAMEELLLGRLSQEGFKDLLVQQHRRRPEDVDPILSDVQGVWMTQQQGLAKKQKKPLRLWGVHESTVLINPFFWLEGLRMLGTSSPTSIARLTAA